MTHPSTADRDARIALLEAVLDALPDPVIVQNDRRETVYLNACAQRMIVRGELAGASQELNPAKPGETCHDDLARALAGEKRTREKKLSDKLTALATATPVTLPDGSTGVLVTGVDITPYKRAEARSKAIESESIAKSQFLANMSHEIRTPLNGVLGMAQALAEHSALHSEQHDMVETMMASGRTLMAMVNDILDLSRLDAGGLTISPSDVDIVTGLHRTIELFQPRAREKGLGLSLALDLDLPRFLRFDPVRTRQCLSNLVSNAIKFTEAGRIVVSARLISRDGQDFLELSVSDTGAGISDAQLPTLFDAFWQADSATTRRHGGAGLGLPITLRLARMMGGDLTVESEPGRGSTFRLTLTATPVEAPAATTAEVRDTPPTVFNSARILIVDDNAVNRKVTRMFMTPLGIEVSEAENGREALDMIASQPFDVVLMDIHMPVMDGVEAIRRIRAGEAGRRDIPVVALTADALTGDRERYLALGASAYVTKPIDQRDLVGTVISTLQAAHTGEVAATHRPESAPQAPAPVTAPEGLEDLFAEIDRLAG